MSNIEELQQRISAAMDRVAQGLDQIGSAPSGPDPEMAQALEDEQTANAQLTERVRTLKAKAEEDKAQADDALAAMRAKLEEGEARMAQLDVDLQKLRRVNDQLTAACEALRKANEEGVGEPHLINKAMLAELDGLRAARASDVAESTAILSALEPLLASASDDPAPNQENA